MAMNPETKEFREITPENEEETKGWLRFHVGEVLDIKGTPMRVMKITRKQIVLKPLKVTGHERAR